MKNRWGDYIRQMKQDSFVGRQQEKALFLTYLLKPQMPEKILYFWGPGGTGKSTLLDEFARMAEQTEAYFLRIDSRDFPHSPEDFLKKLVSPFQEDEDFVYPEDYFKVLYELAKKKKVVLAIDTFEEMQDMETWLREQFFGELTDQFLVVMAGRQPLNGDWLQSFWKHIVKSIPLAFFDLETTSNYASSFSELNEERAQRLFSLSKGHPLTLSLLIGLSDTDYSEVTGHDLNKVLKRVAECWLRETNGLFFQELIEAAAMVRFFNHEVLEHMLQKSISLGDFEQLISLSFIRSSRRGWFIHDLLRPVLIQEFKLRKPNIFQSLWERSTLYLQQSLVKKTIPSEKALIVLDLIFLLEDYTLRSIFLTETTESSYYAESVAKPQLSVAKNYMSQVLAGKMDVIQEFFDPQTNERYESVMPFRYIEKVYKIINLEQWIQLGDDIIFLIKNDHHQPVCMVVNIPIHRDSLPLLLESPISKHYFNNLSKYELDRLRVSPKSPAGIFFYHIDQWLDHGPSARTAFFHFMMTNLLKSGLFIHSSPLKLHQDTVLNLGFTEVPGADHHDYGAEFPAKTYQLDLRGEGYKLFMQNLVHETEETNKIVAPALDLLTPREREIIEWVLKGGTNIEIAKALYVSEITVKKHLSSIYEKWGVKGKSQLIQKLLGEGK